MDEGLHGRAPGEGDLISARYHRFDGIDLAEETERAVRAKIGGVWIYVPLSVIFKMKRDRSRTENDELTVEEWWAREHGYL